MSVLNRALASLKWVPLQSFIRNRAPGPRSTRFMGYGMCAIFGVLFRSKAYFLPTSTPEKEVSPGVPHAHTAKSLRAMGTKPFSKGVGPRFRAFLDKHGVTILAAHNGKRYDHRIMAFHGFHPQRGVLAADTMVNYFFNAVFIDLPLLTVVAKGLVQVLSSYAQRLFPWAPAHYSRRKTRAGGP